jgi:hypothetical protein
VSLEVEKGLALLEKVRKFDTIVEINLCHCNTGNYSLCFDATSHRNIFAFARY